jgi:hypothetical protein
MVPFSAALFLVGLGMSFAALYGFERSLRQTGRLQRAAVGRALRRLIVSGLLSGVGIGLLGLTAFVWGRDAPPGAAAYAWALVFGSLALLGWPAILTAGFMARINALHGLTRDD